MIGMQSVGVSFDRHEETYQEDGVCFSQPSRAFVHRISAFKIRLGNAMCMFENETDISDLLISFVHRRQSHLSGRISGSRPLQRRARLHSCRL